MAKTRAIQNNFLSGELSPLLKGNVTLPQYYQGLEQGKDVVIVPQGGAKRRAGLKYNLTAYGVLDRDTILPTMPNGGTPSTINDGDSTTSTATTVAIGTTNDYVVAEYDLGASFSGYDFVDIINVSLTLGSSTEFVLQASSNGSSWVTVRQFTLDITPRSYRFDGFSSIRYLRISRSGITDLGAAVVNIAEFNVIRNSSTLSEVKLLGLSLNNGFDYVLSVTQGNTSICRFSSGSLFITQNLATPYQSADVSDVRALSLGNVILLFHEDYPTKRIIDYGDGSSNKNPYGDYFFFMDDAPFFNIPQFDYNDSDSPTPVSEQQDATFATFTRGMRFQIDVEGVLSKQITFSGDSTADEQAATEENMRKNLQDMPVFGDTGVSVNRVGALQYRITVEGESADAFQLFSGFNTTGSAAATITFTKVATGLPRKEDVWSSVRGYPRMGAFYNGRLWIGGTKSKPETLFASKSGSLLDFDVGEGLDDEAIFLSLSSQKPSIITDIYPGRNLQIMTASGELAIFETTPASANAVAQTSNGSLSIPLQEADGAGIYCDKNGRTLREFVYSFNEDAYTSNDISILSSHLINTPVATAFLTGTASEDANWLYVINSDGSGAILNKLRSQDINGFTRMTTDGLLKDVVGFGDNVAFLSERTINSTSVRFIETWSFDHKMDASSRKTITSATVSGFDHLANQLVRVVANGSVLDDKTVNGSGEITLTAEEFAAHPSGILEAGLNFVPTIQPMPVNTNIGSGENFLRLKRIVRMNLRVYQNAGIYIDGEPVPARAFGDGFGGLTPYTGIIDDWADLNGWNRDVMPVITCPDPTPMHVQAIEYEVESS